jgi:hypothetical protein
MMDAELRSALLQFFKAQSAHGSKLHEMLVGSLEIIGTTNPVYDAVEGHVKFLENSQKASEQLIQLLGDTGTGEAPIAAPESKHFEQELVALYNEQPAKWTRAFRPIGFGAENVNEIWEKGGEPKFTRKEGGIYNLVEADGSCYVVPEPGLRLQEGYFRSEGLRYLFDVSGNSTEKEPVICLVRPARVEDSGGRWTIVSKGEIRGRS